MTIFSLIRNLFLTLCGSSFHSLNIFLNEYNTNFSHLIPGSKIPQEYLKYSLWEGTFSCQNTTPIFMGLCDKIGKRFKFAVGIGYT